MLLELAIAALTAVPRSVWTKGATWCRSFVESAARDHPGRVREHDHATRSPGYSTNRIFRPEGIRWQEYRRDLELTRQLSVRLGK